MSQPDSAREIIPLKHDWRFTRGNPFRAAQPDHDDSAWETVRVPHDWAIAGPFDRENDLQHTMIWEDGERKPSEHTGRTGGLPHVGIGWYRKRIEVPSEWQGKRVHVEFDGVMSRSTVYLNGEQVGSWPYGYASFCFDLTDHLCFGAENVLAVRVDNPADASRWYPGAGIYRNARLIVTDDVHVSHWGVCVRTHLRDGGEADVEVRVDILNHGTAGGHVVMCTQILDPAGTQVAEFMDCQRVTGRATRVHRFTVRGAQRWDVDAPHLYRASIRLARQTTHATPSGLATQFHTLEGVELPGMEGKEHEVTDAVDVRFGIRDVRFDADEGFFLNGRSLKLNGVCMHHDLGALGAAMNRRALQRQLEVLQEMGCNAIRTSHNPPAPELLELCDERGFLVIDEAFDEWRVAKVSNGYHRLFDDWAERDLVALMRRDRNHPCVILWSIGNEIGEQGQKHGAEVAQFLTDICHREDPTRPVTAGFNNSDAAVENGLADVVDVPGWNYKPFRYREYHGAHPEWAMYGSETESCVSSRGEYYLPAEEAKDKRRDTLHCTAYDLEAPPWGYSPDLEFQAQDECPFIAGEFVWTGWDYLGEPTPYKSEWPSRSSYFGIIDLAGFPKDRFYLYRSKWSSEPTLHLLPHWNWEGHEGEAIPVHCYTSFDSAELFLNGRSLGVQAKDPDADSPYRRDRLIWDGVLYEPGELKVVALDAEGNPAAEQVVCTAGAPARVELQPDRTKIAADGDALSFVTVRIVDADDNLCPLAGNLVEFGVEGPADLIAVDNGDQTSLEPFVATQRKAFNGLCLCVLRSRVGERGEATLTAASEGLETCSTRVSCVE